jgi:ABC-type amino acid transport substrate-binding protein
MVFAVAALILAALAFFQPLAVAPKAAAGPTTLLSRLDDSNVIRAGYGVFPPFTEEDPRTGAVSGVSVDIVNEIARQVGARVEWKRLNWNTMAADLQGGEFDMVADPIFLTPQRGREFAFTEPYAYFAIGIGVVRTDEARFHVFDDINRQGITVAVGQGTGEEAFVRSRAPLATILSIPTGQDSATPINSVLTGRADIAISNIDDARRFVAAHARNLQLLWADNPPAYVPAGFALRLNDRSSVEFLNVSLRNLRSTGVLDSIGARHQATLNVRDPRAGP